MVQTLELGDDDSSPLECHRPPGHALLAGGGVVYARREKSLELLSFDQTFFYET